MKSNITMTLAGLLLASSICGAQDFVYAPVVEDPFSMNVVIYTVDKNDSTSLVPQVVELKRVLPMPKVTRFMSSTLYTDVHFRWDKSNLDLGYKNNAAALQRLNEVIDSIGLANIVSVEIVSQSSPEGVVEHNMLLSKQRSEAMAGYMHENHSQLDSLTTVNPDGESWNELKEYVLRDQILSQTSKDKVVAVIDADINIGTKKWRMENILGNDSNIKGEDKSIYKYLYRTYYKAIRNSAIYMSYDTEVAVVAVPNEITFEEYEENTLLPVIISDSVYVSTLTPCEQEEPEVEEMEPERDSVMVTEVSYNTVLALKTNVLYDGATILNVEAEVPVMDHWSIVGSWTFPWWETGNKYCLQQLELDLQARYWVRSFQPECKFTGWYYGGYAMSGLYDFQYDTKLCYQGEYWSAGLTAGYALPFGSRKQYRLEFGISAGYLSSDYRHYVPADDYSELIRDRANVGRISYFGPTKVKVAIVFPITLPTSVRTYLVTK